MNIRDQILGKKISCVIATCSEPQQSGKTIFYIVGVECADPNHADLDGLAFTVGAFQTFEVGKTYEIEFKKGTKEDSVVGYRKKSTDEEKAERKAKEDAEREARREKERKEREEYERTVGGDAQPGTHTNAADSKPSANLILEPSQRDIALAGDYGYTPKQIVLMEANGIIPKNTPHAQVAHFFEVAKARGLSVITKQIYLLPFVSRNGDRWETNYAVIVGIDGMRSLADKTKQLAGVDEPLYDGLTLGQWFGAGKKFPSYKTVGTGKDTRYHLDSGDEPSVCTVVVKRRQGNDVSSYTGVATWGEYYPGPVGKGGQWRKMPFVMLAKCAKAQALRDAFPASISGLHIQEEFDRQSREVHDVPLEVVDMQKIRKDLEALHTVAELQKYRDDHPEYANNGDIQEALANRHREITIEIE